MSNFLPKNYEKPKSENRYMKFKDGDNLFRILAPAVVGWVDWKREGDTKIPVRTEYAGPDSKPKPIDPKNKVKHFWAMPVYNYAEKKVQILEITQITIQDYITNYNLKPKYGDPMGYDINVNREGEGIDTSYTITADPPEPMSEEVKKAWAEVKVDCNKLFKNEDPFEVDETKEEVKDETNVDDIDFGQGT